MSPLAVRPTSPHRRPRPAQAGLSAIALLVLLLASVASFAGSASAALSVTVVNTGGPGIASRSQPQLSATNGYGAPEGAGVVANCWTWGDAVGSNSNRLWWLISYSGRQFFAADRYLSTPNAANQPPADQPQCGATPPPPPSPTDAPQVWVGSPINGTWDLPAPAGDGPTVHHWLGNATDQGDFAVDLIANAGQPVYLYAAPQGSNVSVTARVDQVGDSCVGGGGGSFATIGLYSGSTRIGSTTYAHLQLAVSPGQTLNRWGSLVGYVGSGYPQNSACWTGPHVHFQLFSTHHYACFNRGYSLGYPLSTTNFLGFTGGNVASGARQACA